MSSRTEPKQPPVSVPRWVHRPDAVVLQVTGGDRVKFLHNVTTNDIKRLPAGRGCEAFVTSLQGKTLAYVTLLIDEAQILLRTNRAGLASLLPHFEKYGALDDVTWTDRSAETVEYHLAGPIREDDVFWKLRIAFPGSEPCSHLLTELGRAPVRIIREQLTPSPGFTILASSEDESALQSTFTSMGIEALDPADFEAERIEAGTPVFGQDITPDNLPQEVGRDAQAISFVKGCYLGQETVARIDALGHVNKLLKGLRMESGDAPVPSAGTPLLHEGKTVGTVTSAAFSSRWQRPVMLAYVRAAQAQAGALLELEMEGRTDHAIVADLPMIPP
jgi:tRNA-modifying protein YgfZ